MRGCITCVRLSLGGIDLLLQLVSRVLCVCGEPRASGTSHSSPPSLPFSSFASPTLHLPGGEILLPMRLAAYGDVLEVVEKEHGLDEVLARRWFACAVYGMFLVASRESPSCGQRGHSLSRRLCSNVLSQGLHMLHL